ncbi:MULTISPECIES: fatty acid metabolism transcriptional regulator FadR [Basfia]|uniref:Fatty acid metabolism regulator protein n=2 Tax=Basfia TaxID=697331 RepID=Q65VH2_MANSM|nr:MULTISPECIES: fatty acid metabolism transcriptional regulator FadR [Basfia]AAU37038.1 FadR protein [[Mannheimia] succiniciproducens MBEL55E]QIM67904.1 fatty acid metabolism regulator [Basfia succiniciproducens]SCX79491.1 transcriptional regulator, GntR family [Basfia succiniciproducens]SEQ81505.1 transcriptional regulator, GntR family [Basfia succiniciproducens]
MFTQKSANSSPSVLKARSPAALAEEYIVKSIWSNFYPPGTDLPAERELAEKIGVTRTTLREVLQRLARDGWLTIQHGKPTKVNDVWQTSGLNILDVLVRLDSTMSPTLIANMLSARTNIAIIYIPRAFKVSYEKALASFDGLENLPETAESYTAFDYEILHKLAFISLNPIYGMVLNSLKGLYTRVGSYYFAIPEARALAKKFYIELRELGKAHRLDEIPSLFRQYGRESSLIFEAAQDGLAQYLIEN